MWVACSQCSRTVCSSDCVFKSCTWTTAIWRNFDKAGRLRLVGKFEVDVVYVGGRQGVRHCIRCSAMSNLSINWAYAVWYRKTIHKLWEVTSSLHYTCFRTWF
jgi:hypothetical protein